jgi:predicted nucleic acid-binding protein
MPERLTISNTSPLLYLNLIDQLDLLRQLYGEIVIPMAVETELGVGAKQGIRVPSPNSIPWLRVTPLQAQHLIPAMTDLGPGEAEAIGLALENPGSRLILDDQLGRQVARLNRIPLTGTVGVILKAKERAYLRTVEPIIVALRNAGLWLDDALIELVLKQAGER